MADVNFLFRVDIGFRPGDGYAASVLDVRMNRMKGIKGGTVEQLVSRIRNVLLEELQKNRNFPMEHEPSVIITPESGDPFFNGT